MRLAPNDAAPERGLLEKSELMEEPMLGPGRFRKDGVTTSCISCGKLKRTWMGIRNLLYIAYTCISVLYDDHYWQGDFFWKRGDEHEHVPVIFRIFMFIMFLNLAAIRN